MERIKTIGIGLFVAALLSLNFIIIAPISALNPQWNVECNYDENGEFTGGSCTSGGVYECDCPGSMPGVGG